LARELYHALGTPSIADFKAIICLNAIRNNPITTADIDVAEKVFGPDIGSLKGKTTRAKPTPVVEDYIEIPKELYAKQQNIVLCIDGLKINGIPFLGTVSRNILYRTCKDIKNQTCDAYRSALDNVFRIYNLAGFCIKAIHCDNEFRPLMDPLSTDYEVSMNYASAQEHVPEAERNNRVIKERFRATFHRLPFERLPAIMIKILAMESAKKLNFFPPKGGVSKHYSPRMILHQENIDYDKHCAVPFGAYVQAHEEPSPTNTQHPRTIDCIYLRYLSNKQGGHELLNLATGKTITRRKVTPLPTPPSIIALVHAMAERDGMPKGLKITTKSGQVLYDTALLAGVDTDQEDQHNHNYYDVLDDEEDDDYQSEDDDESHSDTLSKQYDYQSEDDDESHSDTLSKQYDEIDPNEIAELTGEAPSKSDNAQNGDHDTNQEDTDAQSMHSDQGEDENIQESMETETENPPPNDDEEDSVYRTRAGRRVKPTKPFQCHLHTQGHKTEEYSIESAKVITKVIGHYNAVLLDNTHKHHSFVETFSLKRGIKVFGQRGKDAANKEMKQLHDRTVFAPIDVSKLTPLEKRRAMESLIFLVEKRDGTIKGRTCADGSKQRAYVPKEEATSPTVMTESILLTAVIDAREKRDVLTADIPNAFVQTKVEKQKEGERIIMKIRGVLVDMLVELDPDLYGPFVTYERNEKILYVQMLMALYGMLISSLLYYKKFRKDIESIGFKVNPYDPCVANRYVNGKQHTVLWHVDDLKSSHVDPKVNDKFLLWLEKTYSSDKIGKVKAVRGKVHDYLAMKLDYSEPGKVAIDMIDYVKNMVEDFPEELTAQGARHPWSDNLFKVDETSPLLPKQKAEDFHTFVAKTLFVLKRSRIDVIPAVAFLSTRVKAPTEQDWFKLKKMMRFLKRTVDDVLTLEAGEGEGVNIAWYLDAAFAVHQDYKSHTGAAMTLGKGAVQSVSTKQKINTRSSTESELVSSDDILSKAQWTKLFLEAQDLHINDNVIFRDNQSTMKLEENGKASSGKRTRHFNIKYFYITDLIARKELRIEYCNTDDMLGDYFTKPLTGQKFDYFRALLMNLPTKLSNCSRSVLERFKKGPQK